MAYINFKEEIFVTKKQLVKRVNNNDKIFKNIMRSKNISSNFTPDAKYSFKIFDNILLGNEKIDSEENFKEISNKDIICSVFTNCRFYNIKFSDCNFIGCTFISCDFGSGGITFENCIFIKEDSDKIPTLNNKDNFSCYFKDCNIYGKFLNCMLNYTIFEWCNIQNTSFTLSDMSSVIISNSRLSLITLSDVDLSGTKILETYIEDLEFRDKYKSKIDEKTFFDKIKIEKKTRAEYEGIYMVYETIANKFKENSLNNNFGEYYYLAKSTEYKTLKPIPKLSSFIAWSTCGYGERPLYSVYSSLFIILCFTIIYLLSGFNIDDQLVNYSTLFINFNFTYIINNFNESLNLSIGMFAGVGFNNAQPIPSSYMICNFEMLIGVIMMGLGIGTLTKKSVR